MTEVGRYQNNNDFPRTLGKKVSFMRWIKGRCYLLLAVNYI